MQQSQSRSLVDWLSYLEQIHPANIDMGLERVGTVARRMGLTEPVSYTHLTLPTKA